jgi:hypothetical protein
VRFGNGGNAQECDEIGAVFIKIFIEDEIIFCRKFEERTHWKTP